jgi:hypothetical protein
LPEETAFVEPKTEGLTLKASLKGSFEEIAKRLSDLQTISIENTGTQLNIVNIGSRDIQKRPFLFVVFELKKDSIDVSYTVAVGSGPKLRRITVIKEMLSMLSLITDLYSVDDSGLFQYLDSAIDELTGSMSQSYSSLFNSYDSIFGEYKELKKMNIELAASNKNLTVQALQLSDDNKRLEARLKELEGYSDQSLMVMVEEWLESHSNEIDVNEFARTYKLTPTRVEEILNSMVSLGYIAMKG